MNHSTPADLARQQPVPPRPPKEEDLDFSSLPPDVAQKVQAAEQRIEQMVKRTLQNAIGIGNELLVVKHALGHGPFGRWLQARFAWDTRMAHRFMRVAERFQDKSDIMSDLGIQPTAAYLLTAPSSPEEALETAIDRARGGEHITASVAQEILAAAGSPRPARQERMRRSALLVETFRGEVLEVLESLRRRCPTQQWEALARQMHDFADSLLKRSG